MTTSVSRFQTNQLLAHVSSAESLWLEQDLEQVELAVGSVLHASGSTLRHVYFPGTATVSLVSSLADGSASEVAVVGCEGMVGVCAFMGDTSALNDAVVQRPGHAWRMSTAAVLHHTRRSPDFMQQLLGYTQALFTQVAQATACNRHHALDEQVCRWMLQHLDRQEGNELQITQERMSRLLGVRREGVTCAALKLQKAGLIAYRRGRITVLDRPALEARSCECYGVVRKAYDRLSCSHSARHRLLSMPDLGMSTVVVHRQPMAAVY
ncbi:Crp/Fnr family transcriptional regulator [Hydrogenophaga sp.]|uniref:Crp/Fnr family transcriptional regulator n=1 Tax=Hydrogenophaga sp. TaxID=1904254 RepID=UPI00271816DD|nr:Crp/Fnr family transcriptional regulator [Hydrogenophaga sp.]MDO8906787.1 Crp/Fnr family transcriptional regulator [Hydrogenophaga sp.]